MRLQHKNLTIRQAEVADAKQLAAWWNDGAVMAHAGFPNGLGTTEEEVVKGLRNGLLVVEESDRLIGECNYHNVSDGVVEIGIKICETDCQNRGGGRKVLSMLIHWLFRNGYSKIVLDTNLTNTRAQHVYESLGFRKVRTNIDSWKDQLGQLQSSVDYELVEKDFVSYEEGNTYARQQESQATDTGQIFRGRKRTRLDKGEDGAAWDREYERLPSPSGNRRI